MSRLGLACAVAALLAVPSACRSAAPDPTAAPIVRTPAAPVTLPNAAGSLKFAVLGDFGTGKPAQYDLADEMVRLRQTFPFDLVLLAGDNIYGRERPKDFVAKFERPYRSLLDEGVAFHAALGNHDGRDQVNYPPFGMAGRPYYSFTAGGQVRFFALDSSRLDAKQLAWLERELADASEAWKIVVAHHPLYSSAGRHGSDLTRRRALEPLLVAHGVSVVFSGHDHVYERTVPQQGITYFVTGSGGKLARGDLDPRSPLLAAGFDGEQTVLVAELTGDALTFNAVSRSGRVVDSGVIRRRNSDKWRP